MLVESYQFLFQEVGARLPLAGSKNNGAQVCTEKLCSVVNVK